MLLTDTDFLEKYIKKPCMQWVKQTIPTIFRLCLVYCPIYPENFTKTAYSYPCNVANRQTNKHTNLPTNRMKSLPYDEFLNSLIDCGLLQIKWRITAQLGLCVIHQRVNFHHTKCNQEFNTGITIPRMP